MIRRDSERKKESRENMRGGNGKVEIGHFWQKDELTSKGRLCAKLVLEPGASIGFHEHLEEEEIFVVLNGRARVFDGNEEAILLPGDTLLTGNGAGHSVESVGEVALEMLAVIVTF